MSGPQEANSSLEQRKPAAMLPVVLGAAAAAVITLLSHGGLMGAGMEQSQARVTGGVTRARCAKGTGKYRQAPFKITFKYEYAYLPASASHSQRYLKNVSTKMETTVTLRLLKLQGRTIIWLLGDSGN